MNWQRLFERGETVDVDTETIQSELESQRKTEEKETDPSGADDQSETERADRPNPARIVADADVLAADLLLGEDARAALEPARRHSWVELVASDALLADTERLVTALADEELAADHRAVLADERVAVDHPVGDHPALASAYHGNAAHLLSYDDRLGSAQTGLALQPHVSISVRSPDAFARLFDPEGLYPAVTDGAEYPGPDREPRG